MPLPPLISGYYHNVNMYDMQQFLLQPRVYFADEVFAPSITFDGRHIYVSEKNIMSYIHQNAPLPPPVPCQTHHPLPVIKAVIVNEPPPPNAKILKTITLHPPSGIIMKKINMRPPRRVRQILGAVAYPR
jgi:hypothetical protein